MFLWKEGAQFPVSLLMSTAAIAVSGSLLSRGSDRFWGLGYLLQPLPNHQPEHSVPGDGNSYSAEQKATHTSS